MNSFVNYILESGISLGIFSIIYFFFLRKETFFRTNRIFLLSALLFSILLPLLRFQVYPSKSVMLPEVTVMPYSNLLESISIYSSSVSGTIVSAISTQQWIVGVYLLGFLFFTVLFVFRLIQLKKLIRLGESVVENGIKYVKINREISTFSFLNYVFVSDDFESRNGWEKMLQHEMEHVSQGHTYDVLVLEILTIFQWFNPLFWLLKRSIKENHEFLADNAVISNSGNAMDYKQLLLGQAVGEQLVIANNFNYSLIKNRIKMISRIKSSKLANIKLISGVLVALALTVVFACEQKKSFEEEKNKTENIVSLKLNEEEIKLEGHPESIEQLKKILASAPNIELKDQGEGGISILQKTKDVDDEVVVVSLDKAKPTLEATIVDRKNRMIDKDGSPVFFIVEEMPEFPGGELALRKFIATSIKYPVVAQEHGVQGKVYVSFVVGKDGFVERARVARGVDPQLDAEALRVVNKMPAWKPGKQKGKEVAVSFTVPINFVLQ